MKVHLGDSRCIPQGEAGIGRNGGETDGQEGNMGVAYHNDPVIRWAHRSRVLQYPKRKIAWTGGGRGWKGTTARGEPRVGIGTAVGGHPLGVEPGPPGRP